MTRIYAQKLNLTNATEWKKKNHPQNILGS